MSLHRPAMLHSQSTTFQTNAPAGQSFTASSYLRRALDASPEIQQARQAFESSRHQWLSSVYSAALPTLSFTGTSYPYGHNPLNSYRFSSLRLNRSDMGFTTTASWNIFNSFQDYLTARSARLAKDSSQFSLQAVLQNRALEALGAFYDLSLKENLLSVTRQNLTAQKEQYDLSLDLYRNGLKSLADLLKSETDWRSAQLRMASAQADYKNSLVRFNLLLDRPLLQPAALETELAPGTTALPSIDADLDRALVLRPEVRKAQADLERGETVLKQSIRGNLLPSLTLTATWNREDPATYNQPGFALSAPNPNRQLFLGLSLPIDFNFFSQTHDVLASRADLRKTSAALSQAAREASRELHEAFIGLEQAIEEYHVSTLKETIAHRALRLVNEQYRQGSADAIRLAQAQLDYLEARVQKSRALRDIFMLRLEYKVATGEPLWQ
ncbi:MAG: TolC family protein [Elusimicrobia bacterium]|nr:TolC family protein [Elusimicrobiota bacterium]